MMIPYSFKLGDKNWSVHRVYAVEGKNKVGKVFYDLHAIQIATHRKQQPRSDEAKAETFWHEVVHAVLHDMGDAKHGDERWVTDFSKRLNQVVHTARLPL